MENTLLNQSMTEADAEELSESDTDDSNIMKNSSVVDSIINQAIPFDNEYESLDSIKVIANNAEEFRENKKTESDENTSDKNNSQKSRIRERISNFFNGVKKSFDNFFKMIKSFFFSALLHKSSIGRVYPYPRGSYGIGV